MWRFSVFVKAAGSGHREDVGFGWSVDHTEARTFDEPMSVVRGMAQAIYAVLDVSLVGEWGADSDGDDVAPAWAAEVLSAAGLVAECGSFVEVGGQPFAFVVAHRD